MDEIRVILADGSEFAIAEFSLPLHIVVNGTQEELIALWQTLTAENLETVSVTVGGEAVMTITGAVLDGAQFVGNSGTLTAHFYMHGDGIADNDYVQAAKILLGEEV